MLSGLCALLFLRENAYDVWSEVILKRIVAKSELVSSVYSKVILDAQFKSTSKKITSI